MNFPFQRFVIPALVVTALSVLAAASPVQAVTSGERFRQLYKSAGDDFEAKRFAQAEDKYLAVINAGIKAREIGDEDVDDDLSESHCRLSRCQSSTGRSEADEKTCEQALKQLDRDPQFSLRGRIIDELFRLYMDHRQWQQAVRIFFMNLISRLVDQPPAYLPTVDGLSVENGLAGMRDWFREQSKKWSSPELFTEFCKGCLAADSDACYPDLDAKDTCVTYLMSLHQYADAVPWLQKRMKDAFQLGTGSIPHPPTVPDELAACYRQLGRTEEADRIDAVSKARKAEKPYDFSAEFRVLLDRSWDCLNAKDTEGAKVKIASARKLYESLAYPQDRIPYVQVRTLEGAAAEQAGDFETAGKIYKECLELEVSDEMKVEPARGICRICTARGQNEEAHRYELLSARCSSPLSIRPSTGDKPLLALEPGETSVMVGDTAVFEYEWKSRQSLNCECYVEDAHGKRLGAHEAGFEKIQLERETKSLPGLNHEDFRGYLGKCTFVPVPTNENGPFYLVMNLINTDLNRVASAKAKSRSEGPF
jgi:tetratricopeptide (TPR) repeat protein